MERPLPNVFVEPNYLFEAAVLVYQRNSDRVQNLIDGYESFGFTKEEAEAYFDAFQRFHAAAVAELMPVLDAHGDLLAYFDTSVGVTSMKSQWTIAIVLALLHADGEPQGFTREQVDVFVERALVCALPDELDIVPGDLHGADIVNLIFGQEAMTDAQRLTLIRFYADRYRAVGEIYALLGKIAEVVRRHYAILMDDVRRLYATLNTTSGWRSVQELMQIDSDYPVGRTNVYITAVGFNGFTGVCHEFINDFYVGVYVLDLSARHEAHAVEYLSDIKALSDATRWKMLHMLLREALYPAEIAQRLSLTPATVSHHLGVLVSERLIRIIDENDKSRRARYHTSAKQLRRIAQRLTKLAEEAEHGDDGDKAPR